MTTEILYTPFVNECGMEIETDQFNLDEFGESIEDDHELICKICSKELKSPKVLSCLHAFCKCCLENVAEKTSINNETIVTLKCPVSCVVLYLYILCNVCSSFSIYVSLYFMYLLFMY